jgi:MYXO-CTERM domain-containing protein
MIAMLATTVLRRLPLSFLLLGGALSLAGCAVDAEPDTGSAALALSFAQQARLTPGDGAPSGGFGVKVTVSGDVAVVGAFQQANGGIGSAYVYARSGTTWTEQAKLTSPAKIQYDLFGSAAAVSGETLIIGAAAEPAVYVYTRSGATWTQQAKLAPTDAGFGFGDAIAIDGDTVVVGTYVFVRQGTTWTQQANLGAQDGPVGQSVAIAGDTLLLGDGLDAPYADSYAYVFHREGTTWTQEAKLSPTDAAKGSAFGNKVSLSGDRAVIASVDAHAPAGAAYVFARTGTTWTQEMLLSAKDAPMYFGAAAGISGNGAVVGAIPAYHGQMAGPSAAYLFARTDGSWSAGLPLSPTGPVSAFYGLSVGISGDTAIIGDPGLKAQDGAAYVFALQDIEPLSGSGGASSATSTGTGAGGSAGTGGAGGGGSQPDSASGCSCRAAGGEPEQGGWAALALVGLAVARGRRPRARARG